MTTTNAPAARRLFAVVKDGLGRVTIPMSRQDAETYVTTSEANGGTGYSIVTA